MDGIGELFAQLGGPKPMSPTPNTFSTLPPNIGRPGTLGYAEREKLFPGEDTYFKANPHVGGMAAETGDIVLNPYSGPGVNKGAVANNEALRLLMRDKDVTPGFDLTDQQRGAFVGTEYEKDQPALKSSIAARIYSGDPSARATPAQTSWLDDFLTRQFLQR